MNTLLWLCGLEWGTDVARIVESSWRSAAPLERPWLVALVVLGLVLAAVNLLPQLALRASVRVWTFLLRLAMLALLLVVLARIEWQATFAVREPAKWTVLVDDSASMATRDVDGRSRFEAAKADLATLVDRVGRRVDLTVRSLGGGPPGDTPGSGPTPLGDVIAEESLGHRRCDRLILLTDGRDSSDRDLTPLGDELKLRDTRLTVAVYGAAVAPVDRGVSVQPERSVLRLGEELVVRGAVTGPPAAGTVTLEENGTAVGTADVDPESGRFAFRHRPARKGNSLYRVALAGTDAAAANDAAQFTVQVVDDRINVLLLEGYPRFEFKLFKSVLEVDPLVNLVSVCQVPGGGVHVQGEPLHRNPEQGLVSSRADLFKYDVVVLRDVPRNLFRAGGDTSESRLRLLVEFVTKRGGGLMVCGGQDVYRAGGYETSALAEVLPFDLGTHDSGEPQFEGRFFAEVASTAVGHPLLRLLPDPAENAQRWNALPKLDGSNNVGRFKPLATPLLTRTVQVPGRNDVPEDRTVPVLGVMTVGEGKVVGAAVDTLWRWQLQPDFEDPPLTMLLANIVRYLAPPPERKAERPLVALNDATPQLGQEVVLSTDLRDANFEPVRNAELVVTVTRPDGSSWRIFPRDLPEEPGHYEYRVPVEQAGGYKVVARHAKHEAVREFLAGASAGEFANLSADVEGMRRFARAADGEVLSSSLAQWARSVDLAPAERTVHRELEVWNSPAVLLAFITLVGLDCFLRKRQGLA
ncbi:MAG: hypothetical protein ACKO6B_00725 [Planctomycetia bacterium]